jgi:hypothetical protein
MVICSLWEGGRGVRKLILLVLASAMLVGGLYLVIGELWFSRIISYRLVAGGGLLVFFGGYLLWADFIAPLLGVKTWEDR